MLLEEILVFSLGVFRDEAYGGCARVDDRVREGTEDRLEFERGTCTLVNDVHLVWFQLLLRMHLLYCDRKPDQRLLPWQKLRLLELLLPLDFMLQESLYREFALFRRDVVVYE